MIKRRTLKSALAAVISLAVLAAPVYANPGNGNGVAEVMAIAAEVATTVIAVETTAIAVTMATAVTTATKAWEMISRKKITVTVKTTANPTMSTLILASREPVLWR